MSVNYSPESFKVAPLALGHWYYCPQKLSDLEGYAWNRLVTNYKQTHLNATISRCTIDDFIMAWFQLIKILWTHAVVCMIEWVAAEWIIKTHKNTCLFIKRSVTQERPLHPLDSENLNSKHKGIVIALITAKYWCLWYCMIIGVKLLSNHIYSQQTTLYSPMFAKYEVSFVAKYNDNL